MIILLILLLVSGIGYFAVQDDIAKNALKWMTFLSSCSIAIYGSFLM